MPGLQAVQDVEGGRADGRLATAHGPAKGETGRPAENAVQTHAFAVDEAVEQAGRVAIEDGVVGELLEQGVGVVAQHGWCAVAEGVGAVEAGDGVDDAAARSRGPEHIDGFVDKGTGHAEVDGPLVGVEDEDLPVSRALPQDRQDRKTHVKPGQQENGGQIGLAVVPCRRRDGAQQPHGAVVVGKSAVHTPGIDQAARAAETADVGRRQGQHGGADVVISAGHRGDVEGVEVLERRDGGERGELGAEHAQQTLFLGRKAGRGCVGRDKRPGGRPEEEGRGSDDGVRLWLSHPEGDTALAIALTLDAVLFDAPATKGLALVTLHVSAEEAHWQSLILSSVLFDDIVGRSSSLSGRHWA